MAVDWATIRPRPGQWVCSVHGIIEPGHGVVPFCPHSDNDRPCLRAALEVSAGRGRLIYTWPRPSHCRDGHPLAPGAVLLGWTGCRCTPSGGHASWTCRHPLGPLLPSGTPQVCGDRQVWPPHNPDALG